MSHNDFPPELEFYTGKPFKSHLEGNFNCANRWKRLLAVLVDYLILNAPVLCVGINASSRIMTAVTVYTIVVTIVQYALLSIFGQSIGKKVLKIKIVKVDTGENGGFITNVFLRDVINRVLCMIPFYWIVDILFIFKKDKRCIHDGIAGTVVIDA